MCSSLQSRDSLATCDENYSRQIVSLQSVEVCDEADIHPIAHGRPHGRASGYALKEVTAHEESMLQQVFSQDL